MTRCREMFPESKRLKDLLEKNPSNSQRRGGKETTLVERKEGDITFSKREEKQRRPST